MKKLIKALFSPDCYKLVLLLVSIAHVCPILGEQIDNYLKLLHIYAALVIVFDLLGERRILKNKGRTILFVFVFCYGITLLCNPNLLSFSGVSNFCYYFACLALVYSYGERSARWDRVTSAIVVSLITAANVVGIWMFYTKLCSYVPGRGYIGMYPSQNRLAGLFGNPNVLGMVCLCAICLCVIRFLWSTDKRAKVLYVVAGLVNFVTLLLSNSRTQIYSFVFLCAVLLFMWMIRDRRDAKRVLIAIVAAVAAGAIVYFGHLLIQRTLSLFDVNYSYYVETIEQSGALSENEVSESSELEATGDTIELETTSEYTDTTEAEPAGEVGSDIETETADSIDDFVEADITEVVTIDGNAGGSTIKRELGDALWIDEEEEDHTLGEAWLNGRLSLWQSGLKAFAYKPIFGSGMDNVNQTLTQMGEEILPVAGNHHNTYLEVLVAFGVAGFLCLVAFLFVILKAVLCFFRYVNREKWMHGAALLSCVASFMCDGLADSTLVASTYPTSIAFWFILTQLMQFVENENCASGHFIPEPLGAWTDKLCERWGSKLRKRG